MNYINEKEAAGPVKINKLQKYNDYKNEVKNYINRFIIDNKKKLDEALKNYLFLTRNMDVFLKKSDKNKKQNI